MTAKHCRIGDVYSVKTKGGRGYFQLTYHDDAMGHLIRVFRGQWGTREPRLDSLVASKEAFFTYFPVRDAIKRKAIAFVGNFDVPDRASGPQPMRRGGLPSPRGGPSKWVIVEGDRYRPVQKLNKKDAAISIDEIINLSLLIERIESKWTPEDEVWLSVIYATKEILGA